MNWYTHFIEMIYKEKLIPLFFMWDVYWIRFQYRFMLILLISLKVKIVPHIYSIIVEECFVPFRPQWFSFISSLWGHICPFLPSPLSVLPLFVFDKSGRFDPRYTIYQQTQNAHLFSEILLHFKLSWKKIWQTYEA